MITIATNHGDIVVELFAEEAPISCANFLRYIEEDFFTDTIFHRVIPNFMIQGGGLTEDLQRKATHDQIKNEGDNGKKNLRGTLAMARTAAVDSATSQFFINLRDNEFLDHNGRDLSSAYAVFAQVVDGMDVVDAIAAQDTGSKAGQQDVPLEAIKITGVRVSD